MRQHHTWNYQLLTDSLTDPLTDRGNCWEMQSHLKIKKKTSKCEASALKRLQIFPVLTSIFSIQMHLLHTKNIFERISIKINSTLHCRLGPMKDSVLLTLCLILSASKYFRLISLSFYPHQNISEIFPFHFISVGDKMNTSQSTQ